MTAPLPKWTSDVVRQRCRGLRAHWHEQVRYPLFSSVMGEMPDSLTQLVEQLVELMTADSFDGATVRALGARVGELSLPERLMVEPLLELLMRQVLTTSDPRELNTLVPRFSATLSALMAGMLRQQGQTPAVGALAWRAAEGPGGEGFPAARVGEKQLLAILARAPLLVLSLSCAGRITFAAGKCWRSLGLHPELLAGLALAKLWENSEIAEYLAAAVAGEKFIALLDLDELVFEASFQPIFDPRGALAGTLIIAADVTLRMRLERMLLGDRQPGSAGERGRPSADESELERQFRALRSALLSQARPAGARPPNDLVTRLDGIHDLALGLLHLLTAAEADAQPRVHASAAAQQGDPGLTAGELEILQLLALGKTNEQIAFQIGISKKGVEKRLTKLFSKLKVMSRTEAVVAAFHYHLLAPMSVGD